MQTGPKMHVVPGDDMQKTSKMYVARYREQHGKGLKMRVSPGNDMPKGLNIYIVPGSDMQKRKKCTSFP